MKTQVTGAPADDGVDDGQADHSRVAGFRHRHLEVNEKQIGVFSSDPRKNFLFNPFLVKSIVRGEHIAQSVRAQILTLPVEIFSLLLSSWTEEKLKPSNAYARDFANAVSSEGPS